MEKLRRVYVERRGGFDGAAADLMAAVNRDLGLRILGLRIVDCYDFDIAGLAEGDLEECLNVVFHDPASEFLAQDLAMEQGEMAIGRRLLPGQYDQRADSAAQCIGLICGHLPRVMASTYFVIRGAGEADRERICAYLINPIDTMAAPLEPPKTLIIPTSSPDDIENLPIIDKNDCEINDIHTKLGLAMSPADLAFIRDHFAKEGREPTITEIRVLDTYWSDHCRHTTFHAAIEDVQFDEGVYTDLFRAAHDEYLAARAEVFGDIARDDCLMDLATIGMRLLRARGELPDLDISEEVNASSVVIPINVDGEPQEWLLMFKNETHNHPTEMEPFGGAATCLGGAIRDPLSGRSYVYQAMRITGAADPTRPMSETLPGKLAQRKITTEAASGFSSYGNQIGLATGIVHEIYHPGYLAKRMEVGAVIGAAPRGHVRRRRPQLGDVVILLGGRTGRDGIGGATGSSKSLTATSIDTCAAEVQKGNPPTERKIQRLFRDPAAAELIVRCNDFGAGGVAVAIGELADSLTINLDAVPKKYDGLDGTELAISESQERMAVVVAGVDTNKFIALANSENLEATVVAEITDTGRLIMNWRGQPIVDLPREFLDTSGVRQTARVHVNAPKFSPLAASAPADWLDNLRDLNVAAQKGLVETFDPSIGANTVISPLGGKYQLTPAPAMVAKIPVYPYFGNNTDAVSFMAAGYNPHISEISPFHGAVLAVVESVCRAVAAGADFKKLRLSFQEYFERLGADPRRWGKPYSALLGAFWAQRRLNLASIGGKDSMSGSFQNLDVPPTLISFAVGHGEIAHVSSAELKTPGNILAIIDTPYDNNELPIFENLIDNFNTIHAGIVSGQIKSAMPITTGGIAAAACKMAFGNKLGLEFIGNENWFAPNYGAILIEAAPGDIPKNARIIANITAAPIIAIGEKSIPIDTAINAWIAPLDGIFPSGMAADTPTDPAPIPPTESHIPFFPKSRHAAPRVFIPVFPGSNCEWDLARAFEKAGAIVNFQIINNLTPAHLADSIAATAANLMACQILAIPGGFSAGDEPGGSGKFIAAYFRNPRLAAEITALLDDRDGLILGICNGFQALVKLGLLPTGKISQITADSPALHDNAIGRHISGLANVRIASNKSPWLADRTPGEIFRIPLSHGQGRFMASPALLDALAKNQQIATQYTDDHGQPTMASPHNPNGSMAAIEGITSPDGRILGRMGHSERITPDLYRNTPGNHAPIIFQNGVKYFQ